MEQAIHGKTAGGQANPLGEEKIGKLLRQFAVPSIIAMLVSAVYNIVDQFFIGQSVGPLGNAATNIAFPLSMMCTALALLFGVGALYVYLFCCWEAERCCFFSQKCFWIPWLVLVRITADVMPYARDYDDGNCHRLSLPDYHNTAAHLYAGGRKPQNDHVLQPVGSHHQCISGRSICDGIVAGA